jgi:outer membrane protein W
MRTVRIVALAGVVAAAMVAPAPARAQLAGKFVVTPYVGAYVPSTDIAKVNLAAGGSAIDAAVKHQAAAAFGANASYWLNDRFAIEGGLLYANSDLKGTMALNESGTLSAQSITDHANLWLGSAKLMVQVLPQDSPFNLRFGIGPAIISRSGSAYKAEAGEKITGLTDFGAAMSLCSRLALTPNLGLRVRVENYMYNAKIGYESSSSQGFTFDSRMQNDLVLSAGLQFFLNR